MKRPFATATSPPPVKQAPTVIVAGLLAVLTFLMAAGQLISLSVFVDALRSYETGIEPALLAFVLLSAELLALPFWLRLKLSPAFRTLSMVSGFVFMGMWLLLAMWALITGATVANCGCFGAYAVQPLSPLILIEDIAIIGLIAYVAWAFHKAS